MVECGFSRVAHLLPNKRNSLHVTEHADIRFFLLSETGIYDKQIDTNLHNLTIFDHNF